MKIATFADWFGVGTINGIKQSAELGAEGVQLQAWRELNPFEITREKIRDVKKAAEDCNQTITALCGELSAVTPGVHGLQSAEHNPMQIDYLKKVFDMAAQLNCNVVTTHLGVIPEDKNSATYEVMLDACSRLSRYAADMDAWLAIETGPEPITRLCGFIDNCDGGRVAVNYDPANLVMVTNDDEVKGVYTAGMRIVHTHAKDGIMKKYAGPEHVYDIFAEGGIDALASISELFAETPLGKGSVRWAEYIQALRDIGYDGFLTIEREVRENAAADIALAIEFLKKLI